MCDLSLFVDYERHPFGKQSCDSKDAVGFSYFLAFVAEDCEWQIVLLSKSQMRFDTIKADSNYDSPLSS